jgi:hypothetical protein
MLTAQDILNMSPEQLRKYLAGQGGAPQAAPPVRASAPAQTPAPKTAEDILNMPLGKLRGLLAPEPRYPVPSRQAVLNHQNPPAPTINGAPLPSPRAILNHQTYITPASPKGAVPPLYGAGNINLNDRPLVQNPDGTTSTVRPITVEFDNKYVLIPTVRHGLDRIMTNDEAIDYFKQTGEYLGVFKTEKDAEKYAKLLHEQQAKVYGLDYPLPGQEAIEHHTTGITTKTPPPKSGLKFEDRMLNLAEAVRERIQKFLFPNFPHEGEEIDARRGFGMAGDLLTLPLAPVVRPMQAYLRELSEPVTPQAPGQPLPPPTVKPGWGQTLKNALLAGMAEVNRNVANIPRLALLKAGQPVETVADWLGYDMDMDQDNLVVKLLTDFIEAQEANINRANWEESSGDWLQQALYQGGQAIPQIVLTSMLGGALSNLKAPAGGLIPGIGEGSLGTVAADAAKVEYPMLQMGPFMASAGAGYARGAELQGANLDQQLALALLGGGFEGATEKIPLGQLQKAKDLLAKGKGKFGKRFGNAVLAALLGVGEETLQEPAVDPFTAFSEKMTIDPNKPWLGEGGVLDPKQALQSAGGGASMAVLLAAFGLPGAMASSKAATKYAERGTPLTSEEWEELRKQVLEDMGLEAGPIQPKEGDSITLADGRTVQIAKVHPSGIMQVVDENGRRQHVGSQEVSGWTLPVGEIQIETPEAPETTEIQETEITGTPETETTEPLPAPEVPQAPAIPAGARKVGAVDGQNVVVVDGRLFVAGPTPRQVQPTEITWDDNTAAKEVALNLGYEVKGGKAIPLKEQPFPGTEPTAKDPNSVPIDERTFEDVGDRRVKSVQSLRPELAPHIQEGAKWLLQQLDDTQKGQKIWQEDGTVTGIDRVTCEPIRRILEEMYPPTRTKNGKLKKRGPTYREVYDAILRIVKDKGSENTALAKKIELIIDDVLSQGAKGVDGREKPINHVYVDLKQQAESAATAEEPSISRLVAEILGFPHKMFDPDAANLLTELGRQLVPGVDEETAADIGTTYVLVHEGELAPEEWEEYLTHLQESGKAGGFANREVPGLNNIRLQSLINLRKEAAKPVRVSGVQVEKGMFGTLVHYTREGAHTASVDAAGNVILQDERNWTNSKTRVKFDPQDPEGSIVEAYKALMQDQIDLYVEQIGGHDAIRHALEDQLNQTIKGKEEKPEQGTLFGGPKRGGLFGDEGGYARQEEDDKETWEMTRKEFQLEKPTLSSKAISEIGQLAEYGLRDGYESLVEDIKNVMKREGTDYIDAYHVTKQSDIDGIMKNGIKGSEWYGKQSAVFFFADPNDIEMSYDYLNMKRSGDKREVLPVVHFRIPIEDVGNLKWDGMHNVTFGSYSSFAHYGDIKPSQIVSVKRIVIPGANQAGAEARVSMKPTERDIVEYALSEGRLVPPEVLAKYPDLKPSAEAAEKEPPSGHGDSGGYAGGGGHAERTPPARSGSNRPAVEFPELYQLAKDLMNGKYPELATRLGRALGMFHPDGEGRIRLRRDIFLGEIIQRLEVKTKQADAVAAKLAEKFKDDPEIVIRREYNKRNRTVIFKVYRRDHTIAAKVLAHEIGHLVDYLPGHYMQHGNILGRIASLKHYMEKWLEAYPGGPGPLTEEDIKRFKEEAKQQAEAEKGAEGKTEKPKEEPVPGLTPDDVLAVWNSATGRGKDEQLYHIIAGMTAKEKVNVLKQAVKGIVAPEILAKYSLKPADVQKPYKDWSKRAKEIFETLVKEEIRKRGLYQKKIITDELKALTQAWKPFTPMKNDAYTRYRHSSVELYADAISVWLNDIALLKQKAPTFYKAFLVYMKRKPEVRDAYLAIMKKLNNREEMLDDRLDRAYEAQAGGEEVRTETLNANRNRTEAFIDAILRALVDRGHASLKLIRRQEGSTDIIPWAGPVKDLARKARLEIEELNHIVDEIGAYMGEVGEVLKILDKNDLWIPDLGVYLQFRRAGGERQDLANPQGVRGQKALETIRRLRERLGREKFAALERAADLYRTVREKHIIPRSEQASMYDAELLELMQANKDYARFSVVKYMRKKYGANGTARVYRQIGTLEDIANPFVSTVIQDMSVLRAAKLNEAKRAMVRLLKASDAILPAEEAFDPSVGHMVAKEPDKPGLALFSVLDNGKLKSFYIAEEIAQTFEQKPAQAAIVAQAVMRVFQPVKALMVNKNPLWMARNLIRDFRATVKNNPEVRLRDMLKLAVYYAKAAKEVYQEVFKGVRSDDIKKMMREYMLLPGRTYTAKEGATVYENELERIAAHFMVNPREAMEYEQAEGTLKRLAVAVSRAMDKPGRFSEMIGKVAGYKYLKAETSLPEREIGHRVRTRIATPDVRRIGAWNQATNSIFMFSNVNKEGLRAAIEAIKENPGAYIWKTAMLNILPKLALAALGSTAMMTILSKLGVREPDKWQQIVDAIPEYDKAHYTIIPIGLTDDGKAVYFRLPEDYEGQFWGSVAWALAHGKIAGKDSAAGAIIEQSPYAPEVNPYYQLGAHWVALLQGNNPIDDYTGQPIIPDGSFETHDAGYWKAVLRDVWGTLGADWIYNPPTSFRQEGAYEKLAKLPVVNALLQFAKVSDGGTVESLYEELDTESADKRRISMKVKDRVVSSVRQNGISTANMEQLYHQLKAEGIVSGSLGEFRQRYLGYASYGAGDRYLGMVLRASKKERTELMAQLRQKLPSQRYSQIELQLRALRVDY